MPMVSDRTAFFETASIFEENWVKRDTVNALRNHATGVGGGIVIVTNTPSDSERTIIGCDLYNGCITGRVACNMNANSNASANHAGPSVLIVSGCDLYNGSLTGEVACALTAIMEVAGHSGPKVLITRTEDE